MLAATLSTAGGYTSHETSVEESEPLEATTGEALTPLRPAGRAVLAGQRHTVETEGDFIAKGEAVRFLRREGGRILVRRI